MSNTSSTEVVPSSKSSIEDNLNKSLSSKTYNPPPVEITTTSSKNEKSVSTSPPLTGKNLVQFVETSRDYFVPFKRLSKPEVSIDTLIDDLSQTQLGTIRSKIDKAFNLNSTKEVNSLFYSMDEAKESILRKFILMKTKKKSNLFDFE